MSPIPLSPKSKPAPPVENAPPSPPNARALSYSLRFSGSERTSWAAPTCLNRSSAAVSPGLRSGWYSRASLRYAFLISSCDAFLSTPRTA